MTLKNKKTQLFKHKTQMYWVLFKKKVLGTLYK